MNLRLFAIRIFLISVAICLTPFLYAKTIVIATVNNNDMLRMQKLSKHFEAAHPDINLEWKIYDENRLRTLVSRDIKSKKGEFDVITIGMYEAPIWGKSKLLYPMTSLPNDYDEGDLFESVKNGLSVNGTLYALPFYGESSMTMYRKDLFEDAGLVMPDHPTWDFMYAAAEKIHDPKNSVYGACLRGKAGWGENVALITTVVNSFGGRWFDMKWRPQLNQPEWKNAVKFYANLLRKFGPPKAHMNGYNENLSLMKSGQCGFWVDATVAGSILIDSRQSKVSEKVGFAPAPKQTTAIGSAWLWAWALAIPISSRSVEEAKTFATWATSKTYSDIVSAQYGLASIPPGTRKSTYANQEYMANAKFAQVALYQMLNADPFNSTLLENPYTGIQFVSVPMFQSFANKVGYQFSKAVAGQISVQASLSISQKIVEGEMLRSDYLKR